MIIKDRQLPPLADQQDERTAATQAASSGAVKLLSYSPATVEKETSAAEALLTGDFLANYKGFVDKTVIPAARDGVTVKATADLAGVETLDNQKASILVFVNQVTTTLAKPAPENTSSSVRVGLAKVNGAWLIDSFHRV
ncbi:hypothetical protein [Mycobacterium sp. E342]|uniref:hypothetical protein n=1 Tax=Mycobacterium sp. E342 TaxID=1834147 RepID=UPI0012EA0637|nr:hypothetical protein [Mycobacterium sp. E342]